MSPRSPLDFTDIKQTDVLSSSVRPEIRVMSRLLVLLPCMVLMVVFVIDYNGKVQGRNIEPGLAYTRMTRAYYNYVTAIKKGAEIVKSLLKRTKSIDSNNPNTKIYLKRGGIEKLKRDFYKNKPMEIRGFLLRNGGTGKAAKVADRILIYMSEGEAGVPQLEVYMAKDIDGLKITGNKMSDLQREVIRYID